MLDELLHFENFIEKGEEVVMITTKGEPIGIGFAKMSSAVMSISTDGTVAKLKRVLMDTNLYARQIQHTGRPSSPHISATASPQPIKAPPADLSRPPPSTASLLLVPLQPPRPHQPFSS
ncbi:H/ACA ribonucleoprotein complex subunit 4 [Platanthera guangdongensis]|uniref:H/ACA ribonucleoprotein complex subunit 4 n=1 Tax=Platanthera guangdongensis TaxID=2320717 RepID=A0ABR2MAY3_9ASPA